MAVREFTDSRGVEWRVWDVTPAHIHPATRGEDFMTLLQDGWLAFESGREKRRLEAPYPVNWMTAPLPELEELCRRASVVVRRSSRAVAGDHAQSVADIEHEAIREAASQRVFVSPRGREWTVRLHECVDRSGEHVTVLRFTADDTVMEVADWPANWRDLQPGEYAMLLLDASPPRRPSRGQEPRRRREDHLV